MLCRVTASPVVVVVHPDGTYTVITGYCPVETVKALKK
jgi:hypothetical protein